MKLEMAIIRRGGMRCRRCNKHLNTRNIAYEPFVYPSGYTEMIPVCTACKEAPGT